MEYKKIIASALALTLAAAFTGCSDGENPSDSSEPATEAATEAVTEEATEEVTEPEPEPPVPTEADDPNAITFDDDDFSFASAKTEDDDSAQGELEIVEVQGNKMLRFTDSGTNAADGTVQKIQIDAAKLLSAENVAKVRSIELDIYADATAANFTNDDGESIQVPGWIGGGGGANVAGDKWYQFSEWSGGEYNFEMSGAAHAEFKFILAAGGQCWDETMSEATFLVMRWGAQNEGNLYIDNIVFYDEDGNSLPIEKSVVETVEEVAGEVVEEVVSEAEEIIEDAESAVVEIVGDSLGDTEIIAD